MQRRCIDCNRILVQDGSVIACCIDLAGQWYCYPCAPREVQADARAHKYSPNDEITVLPPDVPGFTIERPDHYKNSGKLRDYEVADDWRLPAILAQALKYIKRHALKGNPVEDLEKARDCITLHLEHLEMAEQIREACSE